MHDMLLDEPTMTIANAPIRKGPPRPQDAVATFLANAGSYEMTSEDDIGDALTLLAASGDAISMYAAGNREAILGRIFSVDPELPHFVMELNEGASLPPGKITIVAVLPTAKIQFRLNDPDWNSLPGKPHMIPMKFPETCAVLDRRAVERVETPLGDNFMAALELHGSVHEWSIYDFSMGGLGLRCSKIEAKGLIKGRKLTEVNLELDGELVTIVELEVRYTRGFRSFLAGDQVHIGCQFVNMTPESAAEIKLLIDQINNSPKKH